MADALARLRARRAASAEARMEGSRSCGDCDLCCSAMPISWFDKPPGPACQHLTGAAGHSCGVYERRPKVCREFWCMWRLTERWLPDWMHPAQSGVVLSFNSLRAWPGVITVHVDPARPDAWRGLMVGTVLLSLAEHLNCLVAIGTAPWTTHLICPDGTCLSREKWPAMVRDDGTVGAPDFVFGPDERPLGEQLREMAFTWPKAPA